MAASAPDGAEHGGGDRVDVGLALTEHACRTPARGRVAISSASDARSVIVRSVNATRSRSRGSGPPPNASITFPTAVAWATLGRPSRAMLTTLLRDGAESTVIASRVARQGQRRRLAGPLHQLNEQRPGERLEVKPGEHPVGERHEREPEPVRGLRVVALDEAERIERREQARRRARVDADPAGDLVDAESVLTVAQLVEDERARDPRDATGPYCAISNTIAYRATRCLGCPPMSYVLECPHCGVREVADFAYGGEVTARPKETPSLRELSQYNYFRRNVAGVQREWWYHRSGCRTWFQAERDTRTNEVLKIGLPGELDG